MKNIWLKLFKEHDSRETRLLMKVENIKFFDYSLMGWSGSVQMLQFQWYINFTPPHIWTHIELKMAKYFLELTKKQYLESIVFLNLVRLSHWDLFWIKAHIFLDTKHVKHPQHVDSAEMLRYGLLVTSALFSTSK